MPTGTADSTGIVALLMEGVDRNFLYPNSNICRFSVALLMEGVDRNNTSAKGVVTNEKVALLMEGVDRNNTGTDITEPEYGSPSSWRAWIEIVVHQAPCCCFWSPSSRRAWIEISTGEQVANARQQVALLAEGVDRDTTKCCQMRGGSGLPSSRRAWIEMVCSVSLAVRSGVALLAEGVDRNTHGGSLCSRREGRPPRGGRG